MKFCMVFFFSCLLIQVSTAQPIGNWYWSQKGLPVYQYTAALPAQAFDSNGKDADLPEDPYFLLGNYRMTLITHVSGIYQFLTAERTWARINAAEQTNYGWNDASVTYNNGEKVTLTGLHSIAADTGLVKKSFGVGFARYSYTLNNNIICTRILSAKPSSKINTGNPAFVITVVLKNNGAQAQTITYTERMLVNFVLNGMQYTEPQKRPLTYSAGITTNSSRKIAVAGLSYKTNTLLVIPARDERFQYDVDPPSVFMLVKNDTGQAASAVRATGDTLTTNVSVTLKAGETKSFHVVIGLNNNTAFTAIQKSVNDLFLGADLLHPFEGLYAAQWKVKLPDLSLEKDEVLRREMLWNAHFIEASAKYSAYYQETFIPQGTVYSYYFGDNISNRDHLQAALPACYTNPELAKSIMRYVIRHAETDGEIKRGNNGFGYTAPSIYKESDEQLYFFNTLAEYLLITKDYNFLNEIVSCFPAEHGKKHTMLTMLEFFFIYLRMK